MNEDERRIEQLRAAWKSGPPAYEEAARHPKLGAAHATGMQMQAWVARDVSAKYCLTAAKVYEWANRYEIDLFAGAGDLLKNDLWVWECFVPGKPLLGEANEA